MGAVTFLMQKHANLLSMCIQLTCNWFFEHFITLTSV